MRFKVGDKLVADDLHMEENGIEYVIITRVNEEKGVYHWVASLHPNGSLHSGYYFEDAILYNEMEPKRKIKKLNIKNPE
jgi:hypothetical protein